ncbi:hypothetical protein F3Y22_tig00117056pilonHSYRG00559 [Hibiscus syriacus]|uniref:CCHC-type domain-containing protein n=1 Tax=Hibiscus syriacus TaxID=106335 RepID=A0A6A2W9C7_HIBSY|nr:hypothetical protein F3Y22_tig00117056pilonHSYRG00559 [Hibiscus syriacus]
MANEGEGSVGAVGDPEGFVTNKVDVDGGGRLGRIATASGKNYTIMLGGRGYVSRHASVVSRRNLEKDDYDLAQHVNVFNQIVSDLARLDVKIEDEDRAMILLCSLPPSYEHMVTTLTYGKETINVEEITAAFLAHNQRKQNAGENSQANSLYVKGNRDRGRKPEKAGSGKWNSRSKSRDKKIIHCYKCKEAGYMKRDCQKLKNEGDMLSISTTQLTDAWIIDSGCSYHITLNREWFLTYMSVNSGFVYLDDDRCCNIVGIGDVRIKMYDGSVRTLSGVQHIPDLKKNLISLGTLHKNDFIPKADEDRETIRIVKGALTVMKGKMTAGNIYRLLGSTVVSGVHSIESYDDTTKLWHMRLAHLSERGMTELHKRNLLHGVKSCKLEFCKYCVLGKQTKVHFKTAKHITEGIIDYVHSDVWGPSTISSLGGSRSPRASLAEKVVEELWTGHDECIFLGYKKGVKGFKFWDPVVKKIVISGDVVFDEQSMLQQKKDTTVDYSLTIDKVRRTNIKPPSRLSFEDLVSFALTVSRNDPVTFHDAVTSQENDKWMAAMVKEMESLNHNRTWELVPLPVVRHTSIRAVLALVTSWDLHLEQIYVKTAFLHGDLEDQIYMRQPEGFTQPGNEHLVCRLKKSLYGLKQSSRQWYKRFDSYMIKIGYNRCEYDCCVYVKSLDDGSFIFLLLYVDDMLIVAKNIDDVIGLKTLLSQEFDMKDLDAAKKILGMEICRDRDSRKLWLSQQGYVEKMLERFAMSSAKPFSTPLVNHFKLSLEQCPKTDKEAKDMEKVPYSNDVGCLMYAMVCTRPDLAHVVSQVCKYMSKPGNLDNRRSTTGYVFTLGGGPICWKSTVQSVVALSTIEAEYMAAPEAAKEALWLTGLVKELGVQQGGVHLICDNQSAIHLAKNQVYRAKTKHIDVRFHKIRELVAYGEVLFQKVHTDENAADMFTKPVTTNKFKYYLDLLNVSILNLLLIINLYVGAQWNLSPGWSSRAAAEAEAVAEIDCSGHEKIYLDGFIGDGNEHVCECNTWYIGPDCSQFIPHCTENADGGYPFFLEPFLVQHSASSALFKFEGDPNTWRNMSDGGANVIEFVTAPNNPDGRLNKSILEDPNVKTIHDRAYYWPYFTPIPAPTDEDLMVFTLSKLTGHAGSKFGMVSHMQINSMGLSKDAQLKAFQLLKAVLKEGTRIFDFA